MTTDKHEQWPVTPDWQDKVRRELAARGRGAQAAMQRAIGAKSATVNEMLRPGARRSHLVARVHAYFGWPLPPPPIAATTIENRRLVESLTEEQRAIVDFVLDLLLADPTSSNARAFIELVDAFRVAHSRDRNVKISTMFVIDSDTKQQRSNRGRKR